MPETISQSSSSELSTIKEGRNIRAKLYAESAFYLASSLQFTQNVNQKYGKVETAVTQYRTTSVVNYTGKIFAICTGQVFLQPMQDDATKVNLILRPFKQPINGLSIKYFVYRGLKKSDFFTDGKLVAKSENSSGFINHVRDEYDNFYNQNKNLVKPDFLASFLGYREIDDAIQNENELIDEYFFKTSDNEEEKLAFELPMIKRGTYLGNAEGTIGIDIVLNKGDYYIENDANPFQLNLKFAREKEHKLTYANYSDFRKKLIRENAAIFMDIASFYGLHSENGKIHLNNPSDVAKSPESIFNLIKNYQTATTTYLYIQSNRQRSYNFYGNYKNSDTDSNNIKIGTDINNLSATTFGGEDWPVLSLSNLIDKSYLYMQLVYNKENSLPFLYSEFNDILESESVYYRKSKELVNDSFQDKFTKVVKISLKESKFLRLCYEGDIILNSVENIAPSIIENINFLNNIFLPINLFTCFKVNISDFVHLATNQYFAIKNSSIVNEESLVNGKIFCDIGKRMISTEEYEQKERVIFISVISSIGEIYHQGNSGFINISNVNNNILNTLIFNFIYKTDGFSLESYQVSDKKVQFKTFALLENKIYNNTFFHLGLIKEELYKLKQIIPNDAGNVRFFFEHIYESNYQDFIIPYKFSLGISFENQLGDLEIKMPEEKIFVYGAKLSYLTSKAYADFEIKDNVKQINF